MRITKEFSVRREEIIEHAKKLFLSKDYENTSMADIMKSVGVAKGTLYHYFQSKDELLGAVIENMVEIFLQKITKQLDKTKGTSLKKLQKLISLSSDKQNQEMPLENLHHPGNSTLHIRLLGLLTKKLAPIYAELIEEGCKEKIFHTEHALECAEFILAGIQFLVDQGIYPWNEMELKRRKEAFPYIVETMLKAPKNSFSFISKL